MRERFGAKNPRSWALRFHAQTAGCSLTAQQPYNNVVRTAVQALAAVLGGTQSLHTNSLDEAWALPTESAATLALRTQQIIAHESGVTNTADPLGGSYFVETLTNEVERGACDYIEKIDALGGMVAAIERGLPAARNRRRVVSLPGGRRPQGKNHRRRERLRRRRKTDRNAADRRIGARAASPSACGNCAPSARMTKSRAASIALRTPPHGTENLMPHIYDAVKAYATLGEICDALRERLRHLRGSRSVT